ncbi:MAG: HlyD family efflux transporter periplasmic adaptor subunit [Rhodospirillaceae bacterium]|nr:HlyD family efflux transporter periplasmic adaptor subunit [Rhodospirillaceae bacterium]
MAFRFPRGIVLPLVSTSLMVFSIVSVMRPDRMQAAPPLPPPSTQLAPALAALGLVEPSSEMIALGTHIGGIVAKVHVAPGDFVAAGTPLFEIDDRQVRAGLVEAEAAVRMAEIAAADAAAREAVYARIDDPRAVSIDERDRRRFASQLAAAEAEHARARVAVLRTELDRLTVRAPIDGKIYRVNVRVGEFAPMSATADPLMTMGADGPLHVRAEIDEEDIGRLTDAPQAEASPRGASTAKFSLSLVRLEPQVRPKRNLAGGGERVDTRVLEAIFRVDGGSDVPTLFPGQQLDVFMTARAPSPALGTTP